MNHTATAADRPFVGIDRRDGAAATVFFMLPVVMFADVIFASAPLVPSARHSDIFLQFGPLREFGFRELRHGNFPLWSPHLFSGYPYFAAWQSALLYPLNILFWVLPTARAITWSVVLHTFLSGSAMYAWTRVRGLRRFAGLTAGILFMFCGPVILHVWAGHLTIVCFTPWVPVLLLSIDGFRRHPHPGWTLAGIFATAMMGLAGYPQYLFFTAIATGLWCVGLFMASRRRLVFALHLFAIVVGGAALSAVQLLPSLDAARETVRAGGASFNFVSVFSFPPENLITLFAPEFFGDMKHLPYWGRHALWEMSIFFSVSGAALAFFAVLSSRRGERYDVYLFAALIVLMLWMAFGRYTPLLGWLYRWVPGFQNFRGMSKFVFPAATFAVMLSAIGLDRLMHRPRHAVMHSGLWFVLGLTIVFAAAALGFVMETHPESTFGRFMNALYASYEIYMPQDKFADPAFRESARKFAAGGLAVAGAACLLVAVLFVWRRRSRRAAWGLGLMAIIEILVFGWFSRTHFDYSVVRQPEIETLRKNDIENFRVQLELPNMALVHDVHAVWGIDPFQLRRYAQFIAATQRMEPDRAEFVWISLQYHPAFAILRCRYRTGMKGRLIPVERPERVLDRLTLIERFEVVEDRDAMLARLLEPSLDYRQTVLLEKPPAISLGANAESEADPAGQAEILDESTDHLTVRVDLKDRRSS